MSNIVAILGLLVKLVPFLKEVFIKNKDFREAILTNRSVIGIFMACIVLFAINIDHVDTLLQNQQKIRDLTQGFVVVEKEHKKLTEELVVLKEQFVALNDKNHRYEVDLTEARKTIQLREESISEYKETIRTLNKKLGYEVE